jgi:hypothetical protein
MEKDRNVLLPRDAGLAPLRLMQNGVLHEPRSSLVRIGNEPRAC